MTDLIVSTRTEDNHAVIALVGELTMMNSQLFTDKIAELIHDFKQYRIIIEADKLKAVDSCGIGAMVSAYKAVSAKNGYIYLVNPQAGLMETLYVTKLDRVFPFFKSVGEAIEKALAAKEEELQGVVDDVGRQAGEETEVAAELPQGEDDVGPPEDSAGAATPQAPEPFPEHELPEEPEPVQAGEPEETEPATLAGPAAAADVQAVPEALRQEAPSPPETEPGIETPVAVESTEPEADPLQPAAAMQDDPGREVPGQQAEEVKPTVSFKHNFPDPVPTALEEPAASLDGNDEVEEKEPDTGSGKKPTFKHNFTFDIEIPDDDNKG